MTYKQPSQITTPPEAAPVESPAEGERGRTGASGYVRKYSLKDSSPILVKQEDESLKPKEHEKVLMKISSCRCRSAWCPLCWILDYMKRIVVYLAAMQWDRVRHIVLTIDRKHFQSLQEARRLFNAGEFIASLTRGKRRRKGFSIYEGWEYKPLQWRNYVWFMEFHKDGTCHFHILLEVESPGKEGMIGQDRIHYYWPWGRIYERPFKSEREWQAFYGYMGKHGYMKGDKGHQTRLPEGLESNQHSIIRRWGHNESKEPPEKTEKDNFQECARYFERQKLTLKEKKEATEKESDKKSKTKRRRKNRTYDEIQASCGSETFFEMKIGIVQIAGVLSIPYREIKKTYPGSFIQGQGYMINVDYSELLGRVNSRVYSSSAYDPFAVYEWIRRRTPWLEWKKKLDEMTPIWDGLRVRN